MKIGTEPYGAWPRQLTNHPEKGSELSIAENRHYKIGCIKNEGVNMGIIDPTEMEDYRSILHDRGYSENEFIIYQTEFIIPPNVPHPLHGLVKIKHRRTGIEREYQAGYGQSWVVTFEEDLKNSIFE